jgi:PAS domain S-box-containing protein
MGPAVRSARFYFTIVMLVVLVVLAWIWEASKVHDVWGSSLSHQLAETVLVFATGAAVYIDANRRRRVLEQSRADLAAILDGTADAVLSVDDAGIIRSANAAARRIFALTDDPGRAVSIETLLPDVRWPPGPLAAGQAPGGQSRAAGFGIDGRAFPAEITVGSVVSSGQRRSIVAVRDLTERVEADRALRDAEERFGLFVQAVRDYAIFTLDATGHVASWNVGAERIKGYRAEDVLGRPFSIFYPPMPWRPGNPHVS